MVKRNSKNINGDNNLRTDGVLFTRSLRKKLFHFSRHPYIWGTYLAYTSFFYIYRAHELTKLKKI
jgi:hypothetical protein